VGFVALSDEPLLGVMAHTTYQIQVLILHPHLTVMAKLHLPVCRVLPITSRAHPLVDMAHHDACGGDWRVRVPSSSSLGPPTIPGGRYHNGVGPN